jgi:energy-converting hydrogenase Eha subunit E
VAAQNVVPHAEMPQVTALVLLFAFVGAAVGNAVAGGIYTGTFKEQLREHLGSLATTEVVDSVFESITSGIPPTGSAERDAVGLAYSDVLRFITYAAVATSALVLVLAVLVPDKVLPDTIDPFAHTEEVHETVKDVEETEGRRV